MRTFFTADTHFDHESLITKMGRKGFRDVLEWNEVMLEAINRRVHRQDRLFILGDFAWRRPGFWRQRIHCRHVTLILGNHDSEAKCRNVFGGNLYRDRTIKMLGVSVFLHHYPNAYWDRSHHNGFHLYGHCHNQREATLDAIWPQRRSMDVSPDTAFALRGEWGIFSDDEIHARLIARAGHDHVTFYQPFPAPITGECRDEKRPG
ncbi:MAG: metallophosphoesterase [Planctomycetota bacterium]|jgi:calcineurin-like phosphoesterase family protein